MVGAVNRWAAVAATLPLLLLPAQAHAAPDPIPQPPAGPDTCLGTKKTDCTWFRNHPKSDTHAYVYAKKNQKGYMVLIPPDWSTMEEFGTGTDWGSIRVPKKVKSARVWRRNVNTGTTTSYKWTPSKSNYRRNLPDPGAWLETYKLWVPE